MLTNGQTNYKSKYNKAIYLEAWGISRGFSLNYNPILYHGDKGFIASSIGLSYVWGAAAVYGEPNPFGFQKSGVGLPVSLTYNYSLGNLDQRVRHRVTNKCITKPPRYHLDWFLESGLSAMPSFYKKQPNEVALSAYVGGRIQLKVKRPYKQEDLVVFLRAGYLPLIYRSSRRNEGIRVFPTQSDALGGSIGFGI